MNQATATNFSTEKLSSQCRIGESTLETSAHVSQSNMIDSNVVLSDFANSHPSAHLSREKTTEIER
jgi:hypothetical protein